MGGTLPVLSRFVAAPAARTCAATSRSCTPSTRWARSSGALLAGFVLLRLYSVSTTLYLAVAINALIGLVSLALQQTGRGDHRRTPRRSEPLGSDGSPAAGSAEDRRRATCSRSGWCSGASALSGFCALGYEVLWTRVLTIAVGASVYGFTIILVAFLTGIALGSEAYGLIGEGLQASHPRTRGGSIAWFGVTQIVIGITRAARHGVPPRHPGATPSGCRRTSWIGPGVVSGEGLGQLPARLPVHGRAGVLHGRRVSARRRGAGQAPEGGRAGRGRGALRQHGRRDPRRRRQRPLMIRVFGIERSLQILTVINVGLGLLVLASLRRPRWLPAAVGACHAGRPRLPGAEPRRARGCGTTKYFAIFRSNQPEAFRTPEMVREAVENTDVLYYAEGVESIVSVIKVKGGEQAFITNGRVEASSHLQAQQCQFTLGHLPMLLNRNPKDVLVVGMGSGMTAGRHRRPPERRAGHARRDRAAGARRGQDVRRVQPPRPRQPEGQRSSSTTDATSC